MTKFVLFAEDDPLQTELFKRVWQKSGYHESQVVFLKNGLDVVFYLQKAEKEEPGTPKPDVIITDLRMPYVDGFALTQWVRESVSFKAVPVVVMTASLNPEDLMKANQAGCDKFVQKPVSAMQMLEMIVSAINLPPHLGK